MPPPTNKKEKRALQEETKRKHEVAKRIRKGYREQTAHITENMSAFIDNINDDTQNTVLDIMEDTNRLFGEVEDVTTALMDSKQTNLIGTIMFKQARSAQTNSVKVYSLAELMGKLKERFWADDRDGVDWAQLGEATVNVKFKAVPSTTFLNGPLSVEYKARVQRQANPKLPKDKTQVSISPDDVDPSKEEKAMTDARVAQLKLHLNDVEEPMNFFRFVINPNSYTQTIENIFDLSFLVKGGYAGVTRGSAAVTVEAKESPDEPDFEAGLEVSQGIVRLDYEMFKKAIARYDIRDSFLPLRDENKQEY